MEITLRSVAQICVGCVVYLAVLYYHQVHGGEFVYLAYPSGSRPNNNQAQNICATLGSYELAILDSELEYYRMIAYLNQTLGNGFVLPSAFWMGLFWNYENGTYTHQWETVSCSGTHTLGWATWAPGEPDGMGSQLCSRITEYLEFRTIGCTGAYDVMCEEIDPPSSPVCGGYIPISPMVVEEEVCAWFAPCWWTPATIGLSIGFTSLITLFCFCCCGWKCFCPSKKIGYEEEGDDSDSEDDSKGGVHDVTKNHNMDRAPVQETSSRGINSLVLNNTNAWMTPEEFSFNGRHAYKE